MDPNQVKMKEFILSHLRLTPDARILDIGCGKGGDLRRMAERVGAEGRLFGIDASPVNIEAAAQEVRHDPRFSLQVANAAEGLPFDDGSMDIVLSVNMLECVTDKSKLLREAARVLKPGGQLVLAHWDWDSQMIDGDDKALIRKVTQAYSDWKQDWMEDCDAWMGRRLWRTVQQTGLFRGEVFPYVVTNTRFEDPYYGHGIIRGFQGMVKRQLITEDDFQRLIASLESMSARNEYFYSVTMYVYVGVILEPGERSNA